MTNTPVKAWREALKQYPGSRFDFEIDPAKTAFVIIDMQYYDAHPDHYLGKVIREKFPALNPYWSERLSQQVIPNCARLLQFFREHGLRVIFVTFGAATKDGSDMLAFRKSGRNPGAKNFFTQWDFEHQIIDAIKPLDGELVVNKTTRCVFNSTGLDHTLRMMGIETLIFSGSDTAACVESSVRGSSDRGYQTIVAEDACATASQALQDASMLSIARVFAAVMDTDEIIDALSRDIKKLA